MFDPSKPSIAVALVANAQGKLLLTWNAKWSSFSLPMTKVDTQAPAETPAQAAVRAAAEVLGVPCRSVAGKQPQFFRGLQKSDRDAEIKDYQYHVIAVEPHPDFNSQTAGNLWADSHKLLSGDYQPLSGSVEEVLKHCIEWGYLA